MKAEGGEMREEEERFEIASYIT